MKKITFSVLFFAIFILSANAFGQFSLKQNYPDPFNPITKISYTIPENSSVSLKVYNLIGGEVATLVNEQQNTGSYEVVFDASNLLSGAYLYKLTAGRFTSVKKMMLVK